MAIPPVKAAPPLRHTRCTVMVGNWLAFQSAYANHLPSPSRPVKRTDHSRAIRRSQGGTSVGPGGIRDQDRPGRGDCNKTAVAIPGPLRPATRPGGLRGPREVTLMADFVKIGSTHMTLDCAGHRGPGFGRAGGRAGGAVRGRGREARTFTGREADDLRTWLNSRATNLRQVTGSDLPTEGRALTVRGMARGHRSDLPAGLGFDGRHRDGLDAIRE